MEFQIFMPGDLFFDVAYHTRTAMIIRPCFKSQFFIEAFPQGGFRLRERCGDTAHCDAKPDEIFRTQTIFPVFYLHAAILSLWICRYDVFLYYFPDNGVVNPILIEMRF